MDQGKDFIERINELASAYLRQAWELVPTDDDFVGWVDSQPLASRPGLYNRGWAHGWTSGLSSFQEWVLTARGMSFADFLVHQVSERDYLRWVELYGTPTLSKNQP